MPDVTKTTGSAAISRPRAMETNLTAVFNGLRDGVFIHALDGTILDVNTRALEMFQVEKNLILGANIAQTLFRPRNPLEKLLELRDRLAHGESISFQWVARRPGDNSLFPVESLVKMIQWDAGDAVLTTVRDITRRRQTKVLLKRRRKQLSMILDGNPIATFVIDTNHHVISWNKACECLTGVPKTQVLNKPVDSRIFYPDRPARPVLADLVLDMDVEGIQRLYENKNLAGSTVIPEAYEASDHLVIGNAPGDFYFLAARCRDAEGEVIAAIETIQDITERTRAQKALAASKKLLTEVTANIPAVVYQYASSPETPGRFTFISEGLRVLFQLDPQDVIRRPNLFFEIMDAQAKTNFLQSLCCDAAPGQFTEFEFSVQCKAERKWYKNSALADPRAEGETLWNGMLTDITEIKNLEQLKADVERMVRHDLKSPLLGIGGLSKLLLKEDLPHKHREFVDAIYHSGQKLLRMINHSMALFKMEEQSYVLHPVEFDLIKMFRALHEEFLPSAEKKSLRFRYVLDGLPLAWSDTRHVSGEQVLLESLFANLIQNAVEAAPDSTLITIAVSSREQTHEVDIHNQGAIPENIRANFFDRYVTCGKKYGTGIGTYSAMLIAKTHNGTIRFTTSKEEGTHLIVTLPRSFPDKEPSG